MDGGDAGRDPVTAGDGDGDREVGATPSSDDGASTTNPSSNATATRPSTSTSATPTSGHPVRVGRYTWQEFLTERGDDDVAATLYEWVPNVPTVPASAIKGRLDDANRTGATLRAVGVVEPFLADGETPVDGHGTPEAGTLVVGDRDVIVDGRAVFDDRTAPDGRLAGVDAHESGSVVVAGTDVEPAPAGLPTDLDWERVAFDPTDLLGFHPVESADRVRSAAAVGEVLWDRFHARYDQYEVPVLKGYYTWDDYADEYFYDAEGNPPTDEEGEPLAFTHADKADALGFDPDRIGEALSGGGEAAAELADLVDERTVNVDPDLDEDAFFSTADGATTFVNRYDLEKAVPMPKKTHFREEERYWVNEPYAFVIVFRSTKENERKYYAVQPYLTRIETDLIEFLTGKLRTSIKYADESIAGGDEAFREGVIAEETRTLLDRYGLYEEASGTNEFVSDLLGRLDRIDLDRFGIDPTAGIPGRLAEALGYQPTDGGSDGDAEDAPVRISARPEPAVLEEDARTLSAYQVEKLLYYLKRDFIGYERIDPIKHDINVEDVSCDGYDSPVFVYHADYEQVITNVYHGTDELDDFVVKLAQRSGKGISKRRPQVDATLPDGSRAQLTLGREVSDHGTNYTIRQFNDVPFTPIDLINWRTFSLDQMAFLWLCIENNKNLIFAGGTASGKTTSLNAVSLFIPSNAKIVSIEDTREVELPQRNWIASVTRPSFSDDDKGDVDEFDLLEAALRQRPDYIVMGEIRGEEGRTAFQVMSTGHTTYTTFHADSVGEVLKRFTTDPINVSKTMFTALDLVSIQTSTRVQGRKVRRNKSLTEINHYDAENDEINVQDVFQWQAETDEFLRMGDSNVLEEIMFDRGWSRATLDEELRKRRIVLAYLIDRGLNSYAQVAATFQAFINDPETVLALMANDELERSLEDLREMESVLIDVDRDKEEMVPRPDPDEDGREEAAAILDDAEDVFETYRGSIPDSVADALLAVDPARRVEAAPDEEREALAAVTADAAEFEAEASGPSAPEANGASETSGPTSGSDVPPGDGSADADGDIDFGRPFGDGVDVVGPVSEADAGVNDLVGGGGSTEGTPADSIDREWDSDEHAEENGEVDGESVDETAPDETAPDETTLDGVEDAVDDADPDAGGAEGDEERDDQGGTERDDENEIEGDEDGADADPVDDGWGFEAVEPAEEEG
ncbi:ATPase, T2SS/T4P/T4SS family [Halorubrum halodurans]|uniref:Secretion system protein E n=1 Tax=Halorubrum halodurans TaxID=1383851 RepID=A0A256IPA6_9EURY|nr:ATPase, T2SS/T4P/T4SS family [Halorubrum halodurans]OYR57972.1 secretion system protein E [Halorubrum halodurans]